ncbi:MAG: hypothetical protein AAF496_15755 [Pseudomonadota bacterium]
MKPAFALSFSASGISLEHHSDDEWFSIGTVPLDAPDLSDRVKELRDNAFALENDLSCAIILPDDQIRYLSVPTAGLSVESTAEKVHDAVAAATPYALSELSFDTAGDGDVTYVAAVALQTLQEAQAFAAEYGFVPVRFGASPSSTDFPGSPEFDLAPRTDEVPPVPAAPTSDAAPDHVEADHVAPDTDLPVHTIADIAEKPDPFRSFDAPDAHRAPALTLFQAPPRRIAIPIVAVAVVFGMVIGAWSLRGADPEEDVAVASVEQEPPTAPEPETEQPQPPVVTDTPDDTQDQVKIVDQVQPDNTALPEQPDLTATDAAMLEALKVEPQPVEQIARDPQGQRDLEAVAGVNIEPPAAPLAPEPASSDQVYLASIDRSDLSTDAIALPPAGSFGTDEPFDQGAAPAIAGTQFDLDERGLVTPTPEGAENPDGVMVYLGRPPLVPPQTPVRFEEDPVAESGDDRLADLRPRLRPGDLVEQFERQQLGGRSLDELAVVRPKPRPENRQTPPEVDYTPTALAVVRVPRPRVRPASLATPQAQPSAGSNLGSTAAIAPSTDDEGAFKPKTVAPKIPSTASVARQATMDNAINLRRLNLIGVYGTPANRRALVRLPSGRYKKLKVGDRIDGGRVIAISDSELRYEKKGRNLTLSMPRG